MSSSMIVLLFGLLSCLFNDGNSLKCYSYTCRTGQQCPKPMEITCSQSGLLPEDRCVTQRLEMKMMGATIAVESRNCTSSIQCDPNVVCKAVNASLSGGLSKCEVGCCKGDLCNTGGPIPTATAGPTGPSGSDLTCYSCSSLPVPIPGISTANADCKNPAKQTCGPDVVPGLQQDRCMRIKAKVGVLEGEIRNCSGFSFCNPAFVCKTLNQSSRGMLEKCDVNCCYGNLCNTAAAPTVIGPTSNATSTNVTTSASPATSTISPGTGTVPASTNILTGSLTTALVMFGGLLMLYMSEII